MSVPRSTHSSKLSAPLSKEQRGQRPSTRPVHGSVTRQLFNKAKTTAKTAFKRRPIKTGLVPQKQNHPDQPLGSIFVCPKDCIHCIPIRHQEPDHVPIDRPRGTLALPECPLDAHFFSGHFCVHCGKYEESGKQNSLPPSSLVRDSELGVQHSSECDDKYLDQFESCCSEVSTSRGNGATNSSPLGHDVRRPFQRKSSCPDTGSNTGIDSLYLDSRGQVCEDQQSVALSQELSQDQTNLITNAERRRRRVASFQKRREDGEEAHFSGFDYLEEQKENGHVKRMHRLHKARQHNTIWDHCGGSSPITFNKLDLTRRTAEGFVCMFDDGTPWFAPKPVRKSVQKPDFQEKGHWYSPVLNALGYNRDTFTFGALPTDLRGITGADCSTSDGVDAKQLADKLDLKLLEFLYSKKMPPSEYFDKKTKSFDRELAIIHMHKLTEQYYSARPDIKRDLESRQRDVFTQSYVASETSKEFLLSNHRTTTNKYSGFLRAYHGHQRLFKVSAILIPTAILTAVALNKLRQPAVTVRTLNQLQIGSALLSTLAEQMESATQRMSQRFLSPLSTAVQNLM